MPEILTTQTLVSFDAPPAPAQPGFLDTLPMLAAIGLIFYFLLIRPQNKARENHEKMLAGLKKGDQVVSDGGIVGKVWEVHDDRAVIEVSDKVRMTFMKESIKAVLGAPGES